MEKPEFDLSKATNYCRVNFWMPSEENPDWFVGATSDEDWTKIEVAPKSTYSPYGTQYFHLSQYRDRDAMAYAVKQLLRLLDQAYEIGRRHKLNELKVFLEIPAS